MQLTRANSTREVKTKTLVVTNQMSMNLTYWTRETFSLTFLRAVHKYLYILFIHIFPVL